MEQRRNPILSQVAARLNGVNRPNELAELANAALPDPGAARGGALLEEEERTPSATKKSTPAHQLDERLRSQVVESFGGVPSQVLDLDLDDR